MYMASAALRLNFVVEFVDVKGYGQQPEFNLDLNLTSEKKTPEIHILLQDSKGTFHLDGPVDS